MADTQEKIKGAIDTAAEKAKEATDKVAEKSSQAAKDIGKRSRTPGKKSRIWANSRYAFGPTSALSEIYDPEKAAHFGGFR